MTIEEILDGYEDLWRRAALENWYQYSTGSGHPNLAQQGACAVLCAAREWHQAIDGIYMDWRCPRCGKLSKYGRHVGAAARHLNDVHGWTWLDFANKFRDALAEGQVNP